MQISATSRSHAGPKRVKYCFCIDVRLGTIALATCQIIVHLFLIGVFLAVIVRPSLLRHGDPSLFDSMGDHHHPHHPKSNIETIPNHLNAASSPFGLAGSSGNAASSPHRPLYVVLFGQRRTWILGSKDDDGTGQQQHHQIAYTSFFVGNQPETVEAASDPMAPMQTFLPARHRGYESSAQKPLFAISAASSASHSSEEASVQRFYGCSMRHCYWSLAFLWLSLGICCLLLYGAITGQPIYVLPYLTVQVACLLLFLIALVQGYAHLPHMREWIQQHQVPFKQQLLHMSHFALACLFASLSLGLLYVKLSLVCLVWGCYYQLRFDQRLASISRTRGRAAFIGHWSEQKAACAALLENGLVPQEEKKCGDVKNDALAPPPYIREETTAEEVKQSQGEDDTVLRA